MQQENSIIEFISLARENLTNLEELAKIVEGPLLNERSKAAVCHQITGVIEDQIDLYLDFCDHLNEKMPRTTVATPVISPPTEKEPVRRRDETSSAAPAITTPGRPGRRDGKST